MAKFESKKYKCPECKLDLETFIPTKDAVTSKGFWDSCVNCPYCGVIHYKRTYPGGRIEITGLGYKPLKLNNDAIHLPMRSNKGRARK